MKILIADDERNITDVCRRYLEREGYAVHIAHNGAEALRLWEKHRPDLLILDVMMPEVDGWDVCETVRQEGSTPVILLTARGEEPDRLFGLGLGADDYVTKPFSPRELVLRVRNVLRRTMRTAGVGGTEARDGRSPLRFEGIVIYPEQRRVELEGTSVELTMKEFDLLYLLATSPGRVFSRSQLLDHVWDTSFEGDTTTVTVHIRRLREKIEPNPSEPERIRTVWGIGYKFEGRTEAAI